MVETIPSPYPKTPRHNMDPQRSNRSNLIRNQGFIFSGFWTLVWSDYTKKHQKTVVQNRENCVPWHHRPSHPPNPTTSNSMRHVPVRKLFIVGEYPMDIPHVYIPWKSPPKSLWVYSMLQPCGSTGSTTIKPTLNPQKACSSPSPKISPRNKKVKTPMMTSNSFFLVALIDAVMMSNPLCASMISTTSKLDGIVGWKGW